MYLILDDYFINKKLKEIYYDNKHKYIYMYNNYECII